MDRKKTWHPEPDCYARDYGMNSKRSFQLKFTFPKPMAITGLTFDGAYRLPSLSNLLTAAGTVSANATYALTRKE
jgi:hypothetical protein